MSFGADRDGDGNSSEDDDLQTMALLDEELAENDKKDGDERS